MTEFSKDFYLSLITRASRSQWLRGLHIKVTFSSGLENPAFSRHHSSGVINPFSQHTPPKQRPCWTTWSNSPPTAISRPTSTQFRSPKRRLPRNPVLQILGHNPVHLNTLAQFKLMVPNLFKPKPLINPLRFEIPLPNTQPQRCIP